MVAPRAYRVEVGEQFGRQLRGEGFAVELLREGVGEVLEHGETDEQGVTGRPRCGLVAEDTELDGEMRALRGDGGVDAFGIELQPAELVGREGGDGAVGGGANLQDALGAIVGNEARPEDLGQISGGVAAEDVHLPEAVLRGDKSLRDDQIVECGRVDVGCALGVALDGDGSGKSGDGEGPVDLRQGIAQGVAGPVASADEGGDGEEDDKRDGNGDDAEKIAAEACGEVALGGGILVGEAAGEQSRIGWNWIVGVHVLIQSLNAALVRRSAGGQGCRRGRWYSRRYQMQAVGHFAASRKGDRLDDDIRG